MLSKDIFCFKSIIASITAIEEYTKDVHDSKSFRENQIVIDACLMHIVNIGEMVNRLSDAYTEQHLEIEWHKIKGLRNVIAHDYFGVDCDEIWAVISMHLPKLKDYICNNQ
jgi:uncharacterized protein with HEPN domain